MSLALLLKKLKDAEGGKEIDNDYDKKANNDDNAIIRNSIKLSLYSRHYVKQDSNSFTDEKQETLRGAVFTQVTQVEFDKTRIKSHAMEVREESESVEECGRHNIARKDAYVLIS